MSITQDTINEGLDLIKILAGEDHKYHARIVSDLIKEIRALDKAWLNAEGKISDLEAQVERTQNKFIEEVLKNEQLKHRVSELERIRRHRRKVGEILIWFYVGCFFLGLVVATFLFYVILNIILAAVLITFMELFYRE